MGVHFIKRNARDSARCRQGARRTGADHRPSSSAIERLNWDARESADPSGLLWAPLPHNITRSAEGPASLSLTPVYINPVPNMCLCIKMHMALRRCAKLAPVVAAALQSARRLGARSRGTAEEAPDALIRRLGREILHHVPVATHVSELGQLVGMLCSSVHACAPCYASRISYL